MSRAAFLFLTALLCSCGKPSGMSEGGRSAGPGPAVEKEKPAAFPPDGWSHRDLSNYLAQKGVAVEVAPAGLADRPDRPASWFSDKKGGQLLVYRCADREAARVASDAAHPSSFSFGRFAICNQSGDDKDTSLVKTVQQALR